MAGCRAILVSEACPGLSFCFSSDSAHDLHTPISVGFPSGLLSVGYRIPCCRCLQVCCCSESGWIGQVELTAPAPSVLDDPPGAVLAVATGTCDLRRGWERR